MGARMNENVILLGAPRSGTSLLTSLLHNPPSFVCLSEPLQIDTLTEQANSPQEFVDGLMAFIAKTRSDILAGIPIDNRIDPKTGALAENYATRVEKGSEGWAMGSGFQWEAQALPIPYSGFHLLIKRNAPFVAVIEHLVKRDDVTVIGMLRDPVATILSWRSLDLPISHGHLHAAERVSAELRTLVEEPDLLVRQVKILNWIFGRVVTYLSETMIVCYEDLMECGENAVIPMGLTFPKPLSSLRSKNASQYYDHSESTHIVDTIRQYGSHIMSFQGGRYAPPS